MPTRFAGFLWTLGITIVRLATENHIIVIDKNRKYKSRWRWQNGKSVRTWLYIYIVLLFETPCLSPSDSRKYKRPMLKKARGIALSRRCKGCRANFAVRTLFTFFMKQITAKVQDIQCIQVSQSAIIFIHNLIAVLRVL